MKRSTGRSVASAILVLGTVFAPAAGGQEPAKHAVTSVTKLLVDNARVAAGEITWAPGTQNANVARPARVLRALVGGTLTVVYADGRIEKRNFETGGVYYLEPDTVANYLRNDGASEVKIYFVFLK